MGVAASQAVLIGMEQPATISFTDNVKDDSSLTTYTFSTRAIGSAVVGRRVVVAVGSPANSSNRTISSVTCGGAGMTAIGSITSGAGGGAFAEAQLFVLQVDTGTTATIAVTWSGAADRCSIGIWALYGLLSSTPTATLTSTANPQTGSLAVNAGGVALAAAFDFHTATAESFTWSGLTEQYDAQFATANLGYSGAHIASFTSQTLTVTATPIAFSAGAMAAAAFR